MDNLKFIITSLQNIRSKHMNRDMIGASLEKIVGPLTEKEIRAYAAATNDPHLNYKDGLLYATPFYLGKLFIDVVMELIMQKSLAMNLLYTVHGEQSITWHSVPLTGDILQVRVSIDDIYQIAIGEMVVLQSVVLNQHDEIVAKMELKALVRNRKKKSKTAKRIETGKPGQQQELFRLCFPTDKDQHKRYAKITGEKLTFHTSGLLAKMVGLPGVILHGVCVMAMTCGSLADNYLQGDYRRLRHFSVRFGQPALPGESLVVLCYESEKTGVVSFDVYNENGGRILTNGSVEYS